MKIALVAHVRHPIAAPFAGGMEAHSWHLAKGLAERGHDVTLLASGDSADGLPPGVKLHAVTDVHYDARYPWHRFHGTKVLTEYLDEMFSWTARVLLDGAFDVIHNNSLHRYPSRLAAAAALPMVTSLHVPPFLALQRAVHDSAMPWTKFTVTSQMQRKRWWPDGSGPEAAVVPNGIDLSEWPFGAEGDGTAIWAGRITPTKGTHLAAQAARLADIPLTIFGPIEHQDYFETEVRPLLDERIRYAGHVSGAALAGELRRASVLLFTPLWDEPFGLAAIEAMACGLPVAATDMGAVREVIGEAGRFAPAGDPFALAVAISQAIAIPRETARARVERHYGLNRMIDRLEGLYHAVRDAQPRQAPVRRYEPWELSIAQPGASVAV